jgi:hypothetical protein
VTRSLLIPLPGNDHMVDGLANAVGADVGRIVIRHFPDRETYLRYKLPISGRSLLLVDKIAASKRKGLWVGGMVPLGVQGQEPQVGGDQERGRVRPYDLPALPGTGQA